MKCDMCNLTIRKKHASTYLNSKQNHVDCMNKTTIKKEPKVIKKRQKEEKQNESKMWERTYLWKTSCWNYKKEMMVAYCQIERSELEGITGDNPDPQIIKKINDPDLIYEERYSKTQDRQYYTSVCPHCDQITGQHYIFEEIFEIFSEDRDALRQWVKDHLRNERILSKREASEY